MSVDQASTRSAPRPQDGAKLVRYHDYVDQKIESTRRLVKVVDLATAVVALSVGVLTFLFVVTMLEHWLVRGGLAPWARWALFAGLTSYVIYFAYRRLWPLCVRAINPVYAAQAIEQGSPALKNSLINLLLFRERRTDISDAVYRTLEEQAAHGLTRVHVDSSVDQSQLIRLGYVLIVVVAAAGLYKVFSPKDPLVAAERVLMPWANIVPASCVSIAEIKPGVATISRGEYVDVSAEVRGLGEEDAVVLRYTTADGDVTGRAVPMKLHGNGLQFQCRLADDSNSGAATGLSRSLTYWLEAGDARSLNYAITVVPAASILVERVDYDYPTYTGYVDRSVDGIGDIRAIEGTRVTVHARANGIIRVANVDFDADGRRDLQMSAAEAKGQATFNLELRDDRQTPRHASYVLRFTNDEGRENLNPVKHAINVERDLDPEAEIRQPQEKTRDVREDESVAIEVDAGDPDFALAAVRLKGEVVGRTVVSETLLKGEQRGKFTGRYVLTPNARGLKTGDVLEYWVEADDNRTPKPNTVVTARKVLRIVSPNQDQPPPQDRIAQNDRQHQPQPGDQGNQQPQNGEQKPGDQGGNQAKSGGEQQNGENNPGQQSKDKQGEQEKSDGKGQGEGNKSQQGEGGEQGEGEKENGRQGEGEKGSGESQGSASDSADGKSGEKQQEGQGGQSGQGAKSGEKPGESGGQSSNGGRQSDSARPDSKQGEQPQGDQEHGQQANGQRQGGQQGAGKQDGDQSPVSSEGDNDAEAFNRIQQHLEEKGELKKEDGASEEKGSRRDTEKGSEGEGKKGSDGESQKDAVSNNEGKSGEKSKEGEQPAGANSKEKGEGGAETRGDDVNQRQGPKNGEGPQAKSPGGEQASSQSSAGDGHEQKPQGSPNSQEGMKPTQKPEQAPSNGEKSNEQEPAAGAKGKKESDSHGDEGGDKAGGGEEGGGQKSPHDGTGSAGQNQSADEGAGQSGEKGKGENSSEGGQDAKSDKPTGSSDGKTPGKGSQQRDGKGSEQGGKGGKQPSEGSQGDSEKGRQGEGEKGSEGESKGREQGKQQGDKPDQHASKQGEQGEQNEKNAGKQGDERGQDHGKEGSDNKNQAGSGGSGEPGGGGNPSQSITGEAPAGDDANLEYARKQTDLVVDKLADQLNRKKVDEKLLKDLGWSEADLKKFVDRWQQRKAAAERTDEAGDVAKRELDDALRSLGLHRGELKQNTAQKDSMRDLREGYHGPVPAQYRERLKAYNQGVSRARREDE